MMSFFASLPVRMGPGVVVVFGTGATATVPRRDLTRPTVMPLADEFRHPLTKGGQSPGSCFWEVLLGYIGFFC